VDSARGAIPLGTNQLYRWLPVGSLARSGGYFIDEVNPYRGPDYTAPAHGLAQRRVIDHGFRLLPRIELFATMTRFGSSTPRHTL